MAAPREHVSLNDDWYYHHGDPTDVGDKLSHNGFQRTVDVFGYNYKARAYARFLGENPGIPLHGAEDPSTVSTRGEYFFPLDGDGKSDFQISSYDLYFPGWATTPDTEFKYQDQNPAVAGEFVWTGFDYFGEPTPYNKDATNLLNMADPAARSRLKEELDKLGKIQVPSRSSYFGIFDLASFKKDRFYIYQARWRPELPMAHILPHWNWPERVFFDGAISYEARWPNRPHDNLVDPLGASMTRGDTTSIVADSMPDDLPDDFFAGGVVWALPGKNGAPGGRR